MENKLIKKILVYLDGSEGSLNALMYSILLSKETGSELTALYVINTKALQDLIQTRVFITSEKEEYSAELTKDAERHLKHARKLSESKGIQVNAVKIEGSPNQVVTDYIKKEGIDLLVLSSIGSIKTRREELTSESDRILRTSTCPVVVVKDDYDLWDMFEEE